MPPLEIFKEDCTLQGEQEIPTSMAAAAAAAARILVKPFHGLI